ncbi:MAG: hypothetical protein JW834_03620 [Candidatus Diapherotrites archaeon]|nr:hypothetical protein [Candidatus Diapherotrites archaeon]
MEVLAVFGKGSDVLECIVSCLSPERVTILCRKNDLQDVLRERNAFALVNSIPTAVDHVSDVSVRSLCKYMKRHNGVTVCVGSGDAELDNCVLEASLLSGRRACFFLDGKPKYLPALQVPVIEMLPPVQRKLLRAIKRFGPMGLKELSRLNGFSKRVVDENVLGEGLVRLGLAELDDDRISITELGELVLST